MKSETGFSTALTQCIRNNKMLFGALIFIVIAAAALSIIPPLVLEKTVNELSAANGKALKYGIFYFIFIALSGISESAKEVIITKFGQKVTHRLRSNMAQKLSLLPSEYFVTRSAGVTVSKFVNDADTVDSLFNSGIIGMFADALTVAGIIIVIFIKSFGLGLIMCALTPVVYIFTRACKKKMFSAQLSNRTAVGRVNNHLPETIKNIRMIHSFGKEKYMSEKYDEYISESYAATEKSNFYDSVYSPVIILLSTILTAAMFVLAAAGGKAQSFFGMSVGTAVAIIAYVGKVFAPIESIGMEIQSVQSAAAGIRRINEFLNEDEIKIAPHGEDNPTELAVDMRRVSFSYGGDKKVLNNYNLSLKKGEKVTLRGKTGIGKSTVLKLLLGLYEPESGEIFVNGKNTCAVLPQEKRKIFGLVEQSFTAVSGSVADQITLFDGDISREEMRNAARKVGIDEYIVKLPKGYDSDFSAVGFSQGQLQLLAVARAVVKNPQILLLDEMSANLDADTQAELFAALSSAAEGKTVISVSHRLYGTQNMRVENIV